MTSEFWPTHPIDRVIADALSRDPTLRIFAEGDHPAHRAWPAERVAYVPMADRAVLGMALGCVVGGNSVIIEVSSVSRIFALAELLAEVAAMAPGYLSKPLILRVPWTGEATVFNKAVLSLISAIHGLRCYFPSDEASGASFLQAALASSGPMIVLESAQCAPTLSPQEPHLDALRLLRSGRQLTIIAAGPDVSVALQAAESLSRDGLDVDVIDLVCVHPVDLRGVEDRVRQTGRLLIVAPYGERAWAEGLRVAALDRAFLYLESPLVVCSADVDIIEQVARDTIAY